MHDGDGMTAGTLPLLRFILNAERLLGSCKKRIVNLWNGILATTQEAVNAGGVDHVKSALAIKQLLTHQLHRSGYGR